MRQYAAKLILIAESRYDFTEKRTSFKVFWLWRRRSETDDARAGTYTAGRILAGLLLVRGLAKAAKCTP